MFNWNKLHKVEHNKNNFLCKFSRNWTCSRCIQKYIIVIIDNITFPASQKTCPRVTKSFSGGNFEIMFITIKVILTKGNNNMQYAKLENL